MTDYHFFYSTDSPLSNFFPINNNTSLTSEKMYMTFKAVAFHDTVGISLLRKCLTPRDAKKIGQKVSNYKESIWTDIRYSCMLAALDIKFKCCQEFRDELIKTQDKYIVEASITDRIWGIGFSEEDALKNIKDWGLNLLGVALMQIRKEKLE